MKNYLTLNFLIIISIIFLNKSLSEDWNTNLLSLHSFSSPITENDLNNGWILDYSTTSTNEYLVLIPNVYNRRGLLYHEKPIISDNINIEFTFHINQKVHKETLNEKYYKYNDIKPIEYKINGENINKRNAFGLWVLENQFTVKTVNSENNLLEEDEFILYGYKKNFNGVGIFFELKGKDLIVSGFANNGNNNINLNDKNRKRYNFDSLIYNGLITVKIKASKSTINVYFYDSKKLYYMQSISIKKPHFKENYIGFSSFNFKEDENIPLDNVNKYKPTFVGLKEVRVFTLNSDEYTETETNKPTNYEYVNNILKEFPSDQNHTNQTEELNNIFKLLKNFMEHQITFEQKVFLDFDIIKKKLQNIEVELKLIKKNHLKKSDDPKNFQKIFTTELSGLKNLFHSHTLHHEKNIEDITKKLTKKIDDNQELKILAEKAEKLENIINKGNSTTYIFSIGFTGLIVTTLILIYKKIRDVEKKHIL